MACIVLEQMCREVGRPRLTALATTVHFGMTENFPINIDKHIDDMLNLGSRYINIECTMGRGICLLLGCNLPESHWSKLLPKKGDLFDAVMQQLRSSGMEQLSAQYASLRDGIVRSRMDLLRDVGHRALVVQVSPVLNHELMSPGSVYREARQEMLGLE